MDPNDQSLSSRLDILQAGQSRMETAVARLADAMVQIARIEVTMTFNSEAIARAFTAIEKLTDAVESAREANDKRIKALEEAAPINSMASRWVFGTVTAGAGAVGGALLVLVLFGPK